MATNIGKNRSKKSSEPGFDLLSDEQILIELGRRFERYRNLSAMADQVIFDTGGVKKDALANFKKGRNISLLNFIKILRGGGLLNELNLLLSDADSFSPIQAATKNSSCPPKRVRKRKKKGAPFRWGED